MSPNKKWMQDVRSTGAFRGKAKKHDMSTLAFADYVLDNTSEFDRRTVQQANAAANMIRASRRR